MEHIRNDEAELDSLWANYRQACPVPDATAEFMPNLWARIENRHTFSFVFGKLGRMVALASLAMAFCLAAANMLVHNDPVAPSYAEALLSDSSAEQTSYTEAIQISPKDSGVPANWGNR